MAPLPSCRPGRPCRRPEGQRREQLPPTARPTPASTSSTPGRARRRTARPACCRSPTDRAQLQVAPAHRQLPPTRRQAAPTAAAAADPRPRERPEAPVRSAIVSVGRLPGAKTTLQRLHVRYSNRLGSVRRACDEGDARPEGAVPGPRAHAERTCAQVGRSARRRAARPPQGDAGKRLARSRNAGRRRRLTLLAVRPGQLSARERGACRR
jgi:hypothetical protein